MTLQGFSTNIFINYGNNTRLNPYDFAVIGKISETDMAVVDSLYHGYGECLELCDAGSTDPYCVGTGDDCNGVSMDALVAQGAAYWKSQKPKMDFVKAITVS